MANLDNIRVVLVGTTHPGNIGAAARAMKNMGLNRLYLVSPRSFPHEKAVWRAAGAADVVETAIVVESLDQAIADCQLVVGTSARERRIPWPLAAPDECAATVLNESAVHQCALLFGREARGLTNAELQCCQLHVHIPTANEYTSLNLAMAVQIMCYEVQKQFPAITSGSEFTAQSMTQWDQPLADHEATEHFFHHLEKTLIALDFHDPDNPRQLITRIRRMFQRIRPDVMEINILRGVLSSIDKHLRK